MSASKSIVHKLTPSQEGAYSDMKAIIESGEELATAYFADNDLIAVGAMRALISAGYRIPEDVSIVGSTTAAVRIRDPAADDHSCAEAVHGRKGCGTSAGAHKTPRTTTQ